MNDEKLKMKIGKSFNWASMSTRENSQRQVALFARLNSTKSSSDLAILVESRTDTVQTGDITNATHEVFLALAKFINSHGHK